MACLPLLPIPPRISSSSETSPTTIQNKTIPTVNFSQRIPSWASLSRFSSPSSTTTNQTQTAALLENLHLVSLSKQGKLTEALQFLQLLQTSSTSSSINTHSFNCLLDSCSSLSDVRIIHKIIQTTTLTSTTNNPSHFLYNSLLRKYCEMGSLSDARNLFDEMPKKDSVSWITMISAYAENGLFGEAFTLCAQLPLGPEFDSVCLTMVRAFSAPSCLELGKQIHSLIIRRIGLTPDVWIDTALSNMYVKCGCLESAKLVLDRMVEKRNAVSWTGLMVGYTQADKPEEALLLFERMVKEGVDLDGIVFSVVLKACSLLNDLHTGRKVHGWLIKCGMGSDVSVGTPIVDFYIKCECLDEARWAFERISHPNDVSWSSMIIGYLYNCKFEECLGAFKNVRHNAMLLNSSMYTSIFQACSMLADLNLGTQVHADAIKRGLVSDLYGESALVTMYSRSGRLDYARRTFDLINQPDTVAWTAIIAGCAYHGHASEAVQLFQRMQNFGVRTNAVTFIGLFTACSHSGLVLEARQYLDSMHSEFGVEPTIDHYDCMIDIYSRAGQLEEAFHLIKTMPFEPDAMSWKSLLGGCGRFKNIKLGKIAAENLLQLDPEDTAGYVLLFNLYASSGRWDEAAHIRKAMVEKDLRKDVSCSWLTIKGKVHRFVVGDRHHPQKEEIYSKLEELNFAMKKDGTISNSYRNALYSLPEERNEQLLDHSERLAIAYGLISTPTNAPILVFKNLRACTDCHDFAKHVSKITGRKIVVRDSSRFHHFMFGECSCNGYW